MESHKKISRAILTLAILLFQLVSYSQTGFTGLTGLTGTTGATGSTIGGGVSNGIKPSGGDNICSATPIKTGLACTQYSNDTATASPTTQPSCWADVTNDVWFSFVATAPDMTVSTDAVIFELFPGTTLNDSELALYSTPDGACGSTPLIELGCDQDSGINSGIDLTTFVSGPTTQALLERTHLVPGKTYYVRVQGHGGKKGNFCLSAFDTYTVGSKPCEAQAIHPNSKTACDFNDGNAVKNEISTKTFDPVTTMQPDAYVPLGQTFSCAPGISPGQYGGWVTWIGGGDGTINVNNISGNAVDYTLFSGVCTHVNCISSQPCAVGGSVTFNGLTSGTTYYMLTTLQGGAAKDGVDGFKTDVCIKNTLPVVHPSTDKNVGGVAGAGGKVNTDHCDSAYAITVDQVYKTTTYGADSDVSGCSYGNSVWFTWKVPGTYPGTPGVGGGPAFFQMWNKNCSSGPGSPGTRLIVAISPPCSGGCLQFSSPSQQGLSGSAGDKDPYTDAATNVGWDAQQYSTQYWGIFQSGNDGIGKENCDFNFMIGSTPSLKGITVDDHTICQGQSARLEASGGTAYEWGNAGETTASITVTPSVSTSYTVTATAGADGYAVGYVTVIPFPFTVTATPGAICSGSSSATLTASTTTTSTLTPTYTWTPSTNLDLTYSVTVHANPPSTTTYTVTSILGASGTFTGCRASTPVTVTVGGSIPVMVNSGAACPGVGAALTASGGITYTWTPTTNLVPASGIGTSVTASPGSTTTYTVTGENNGCKGTATATVTISTTPTITVNSPSICAGNTATLTASGGSTYVWLSSSGATTSGASLTTPVLNAPATYTVTGTSASGCSAKAIATVSINSGLNVVVSASNGGSFCPAGPVNAGGSTTLSVTGATTYTWTPATGLSATNGASVTATPTVTTTYSVNGSDAGGCVGSSSQLVTVLSLDNATFNYSSNAFCIGTGTTNSPTLTTPGGSFSISPASGILNTTTGDIIVPTGTPVGAYIIKYTTANQCPNSYTVNISVVANPSATFSYDAPGYCNNAATAPVLSQPAGSTKGTFTATPPGLTINAATGVITLATSSPNTYTVTNSIAAGGGCLATSSYTVVTVNPVPAVTSTSTTVCAGSPGTITASGATSYAWAGFPAGATLTDSPVANKTYTVTGTANGCSSTGTGTIYVNALPVVGVIPPPAAVCPGKPATLTATGATSYVWTGGPGGATATLTDSPLATTTYSVTGTSGICTGTATGVITVGSAPTVTTADASICSGSTGATLTANGGVTYSWSTTPPQTTASINVNPLVTTTYTVTGTGATAGCNGVAYATVVVNTTPAPAIAFAPGTICLGKTSTITATPAGAASYTWSSGGPGSPITVSPLVTTLYTVTVTSTAGCSATASGSVVVNPIPAVGVNNATICSGQTAKLTATGATSYAWLPNIGAIAAVTTPTLSATTSYTVTGTSAGCSKTAVSNVVVSPTPTVTVNSVSICTGGTVNLMASGAATYTWTPGGSKANPLTIVANATTVYTATGSSAANCTSTGQGTVTAYPLPKAAFDDLGTITLSQANLSFVDKSTNAASWLWDFGDTVTSTLKDPQHIYADTGTFVIWLKVLSAGGCADSVPHDVKILPDLLMYIPNAFTPDGDNLNDAFSFKNSGLTAAGFEFRVFNRWGEQMFYTTDITAGWKGDDTKGGACPQDVYVYSIIIKDGFGKDKKYLGNITLIR